MKSARVMLTLLLLAIGAGALFAESSNQELEAKIKQLEAQIAAQQAMLEELKTEIKSNNAATKESVETTVKETVTKEMKAYSGLKDLKIGGDLRLRYEPTMYDSSDRVTRNRFRMRFRFRMSKEFKYGVAGHVQLASGSAKAYNGVDLGSEPVSTNQTFDRSFEEKPFWLDQAYITWTPEGQDVFTFAGGKFKNPFTSTWMVWDTDVNPEGFYQQLAYSKHGVKAFFNLAEMVLKENGSGADSYVIGYQGGLGVKNDMVGADVAVAYYDYKDYTFNFIYTNGNTTITLPDDRVVLAAGDFNILDVVGKVNFNTRVPVGFVVDYAKNLGDKTVGTYAGQDTAWLVGGTFGKARKQASWQAGLYYANIEANAVVGAFNDSDFGHANRKGPKVDFKYMVYDNLECAFAYFHNDKVLGTHDKWNKVQLDLVFKF